MIVETLHPMETFHTYRPMPLSRRCLVGRRAGAKSGAFRALHVGYRGMTAALARVSGLFPVRYRSRHGRRAGAKGGARSLVRADQRRRAGRAGGYPTYFWSVERRVPGPVGTACRRRPGCRPWRSMIAETFFCAELLRPMRTQKFRDHAADQPGSMADRAAGRPGGRISANLTALTYRRFYFHGRKVSTLTGGQARWRGCCQARGPQWHRAALKLTALRLLRAFFPLDEKFPR
jgi:hypothetical protein